MTRRISRLRRQLWTIRLRTYCATLLCVSGVALLFAGFLADPMGIIDTSVLIAFGEVLTSAGAFFGVVIPVRGPRVP